MIGQGEALAAIALLRAARRKWGSEGKGLLHGVWGSVARPVKPWRGGRWQPAHPASDLRTAATVCSSHFGGDVLPIDGVF